MVLSSANISIQHHSGSTYRVRNMPGTFKRDWEEPYEGLWNWRFIPVGIEETMTLSCAVTEIGVKVALTPAPEEGVYAYIPSGHCPQWWAGVSPQGVLCCLLNSGISGNSTMTDRVCRAPQYLSIVLRVIPGSVRHPIFLKSAFGKSLGFTISPFSFFGTPGWNLLSQTTFCPELAC